MHRSNVTKKPEKSFNACDDFLKLHVTTCYILTASLQTLGMTALTDTPSHEAMPDPMNLWAKTKEDRKKILTTVCESIVDQYISFKFHEVDIPSNDQICKYSKRLLSLGCFYLNFTDAIKEGDGDRVLQCWRYLLPIFKSSGRKNYSIEVLNMLLQYHCKLTPRQSAELI